MARGWRKGESGRPATLGTMARGSHDLFARCNSCLHQISFGPAEMAVFAERYGPDTLLYGWAKRLRCSRCGSRDVDSVVSGTGPMGAGH